MKIIQFFWDIFKFYLMTNLLLNKNIIVVVLATLLDAVLNYVIAMVNYANEWLSNEYSKSNVSHCLNLFL